MPHMMPMMWIMISLITLISLLMIINLLYFFMILFIKKFLSSSSLNYYQLIKKNKWIWKW
uniref:ATP synthase F0 subunit 8 n=1 Tax=Acropyga sauteri TaxID=602226 RepID=A0A6G5NJ33_9HYME|nr:ATP synthase F0 subunit 8 [Acropyga sauteri]QBG38686.1 ATP synthase F0 subunit 8 [Acropyga sauteri]